MSHLAPLVASLPRLLVVSHVLPYPGSAGQQRRVAMTLAAARETFEVHFLTFAGAGQVQETTDRLRPFCHKAIVLESAIRRNPFTRLAHKALGVLYGIATGLKHSNYAIGRVELTRARLEKRILPQDYDCVLYEYIHAASSARLFQASGVPVIVDTHDILWHTREKALARQTYLPRYLRRRWLRQYRRAEELAWKCFDGVVAINRSEECYMRQRLPDPAKVFYVPMGINLADWPFCWNPAQPPRVAFYGGLGSQANQEAAERCLKNIMPSVWQKLPDAEFWLVGSNPPARFHALAGDRVKVTGFVQRVEDVLCTMSLVLCPWSATYGFRSRLIEVMALGVPVVASPEAVDGMELEHERGILFGHTDPELARQSLRLLSDQSFAKAQSTLAREVVQRLYSVENTYGRLFTELRTWLDQRKARVQKSVVSSPGVPSSLSP